MYVIIKFYESSYNIMDYVVYKSFQYTTEIWALMLLLR